MFHRKQQIKIIYATEVKNSLKNGVITLILGLFA